MAEKHFVTDDLEQQLRRSQVIIPSKPNAWVGSWRDGERFTAGQLYELAARGIDPTTLQPADVLEVHLSVGAREVWQPPESPTLYRRIACPIVGGRGDRVLVVAPSGERKLVYPNGSLRKSKGGRARGVR